jgi:hypothetical protein
LGLYRVRLYCDLEAHLDAKKPVLRILPLNISPCVKERVTLYSLTAHGCYTSQSIFHQEGRDTRVDYYLQLRALLPKPFGLNLIPDGVLNRIAQNITQRRIHEIADSFVKRVIQDFERQPKRQI